MNIGLTGKLLSGPVEEFWTIPQPTSGGQSYGQKSNSQINRELGRIQVTEKLITKRKMALQQHLIDVPVNYVQGLIVATVFLQLHRPP
ncbi:hypothetical protein DYH09_26720 [bacterium CPR1]|nr:hypothetical protein [bacterium CPR1]